ncbi:MAG: phosphatase PAP2 family protein [Candidatus Eisenbacteria bacterium]|uniref:Phosphatase PAP2 family protein n=1 Tax=Eiseniibacteriota bacterium TaxID=2212470 RepID=A0A538T212_UNCEI|nr:MAG: phosphatase PAP2 family protein [Candidatus Eisenbacteria bacterium]
MSRLGERWRRAVFALRPEECATLLLFLPMAYTLARMSATRADLLDGPAAAYPGAYARLLVLLASTALFLWIVWARPHWKLLRDGMPFVFCANIYANLHDLIHFFHASDITNTLYQWDLSLFGFEPTIWAERFANPLLTDFFTVCYWLFYVLGPMLGLFLYLRKDHRAFRYTMVTLVLCLYLGYIGYVAWPASAPRLFMPGAYLVPLHGSPLLDFTRKATVVIPLTAHGAFPSLHCAVALLAVLLAWRYQRWFFWVQLPFATGLIVGTVYLRHHWVVDILAGFVLTFAAYWAGPRVEDWWSRHAAGSQRPALAQQTDAAQPVREPEPTARVAAKVMESWIEREEETKVELS